MKPQKQAAKFKAQGLSVRDIAGKLNVSKSTVSRWLKSFTNPTWTTVQGGGDLSGPVDLYGGIPQPSGHNLVKLFDDTVFICCSWLANAVSQVPLQVLVTTQQGQARPKCATTPVVGKSLRRLKKHPILSSKVLKAETTRLVTDHPLMDLLECPNGDMNSLDFIRHIDLQLSLIGNCFIHVVRDDYGLPIQLWPLWGQYVALKVEKNKLVCYEYQITNPPTHYAPDDIIHIKLDDVDGDGLGEGPVRAMYERILLGKNELAYLNSLYRNQARPDSIIQVKGGLTSGQSERLQKEINMRFRQGGMGGVWAVDADEIDVKPLGWSPKDTLGTELYKWTKLQICNGFGLNIALFDSESSNRAVADTARYLAQVNAVLPRLRVIEEKLNQRLVPEFDERLCIAFEEAVDEDEEATLKERDQAIQIFTQGAISKNELRAEFGFEPTEDGDEPHHAVQQQAQAHQEPAEQQDDNPPEQADIPVTSDLRTTVGGLQAIASLQQAFYSGQIPQAACIANVKLLFGFSDQEAAALFVPVPPKKLTQDDASNNQQAQQQQEDNGLAAA